MYHVFPITPSNLSLVYRAAPARAATPPPPSPTNHLAVIDCSGSMAGDLPKLRAQLKSKLVKLLGPKDTLSIVWFSGKGEFGTLLEVEPIAGLKDLTAAHAAIDRWLRPVGMTGFKEPLEEVTRLIKRTTNGYPWSLFFMSDGCDNQWARAQILDAATAAAAGLAAATFVEYGYYADRALLAAMAAKAGGTHIFAADFPAFEPIFAQALQRQAPGAPKVEIDLPHGVVGDFVYAVDTERQELRTYEVKPARLHDVVQVDADVAGVWYLTRDLKAVIASEPPAMLQTPARRAKYAALSLFAMRAQPDVIYDLLRHLGDVAFIRQFGGCFGKQRYSDFMARAHAATFDLAQQCVEGYDSAAVPPDDAFTVFELLHQLEAVGARVLLDRRFSYNRISRVQLDADTTLTAAQRQQLDDLQAAMKTTRSKKKLAELNAQIDQLLGAQREALVFAVTPEPEGYAIDALTFNETRPNISILVRKPGMIDLRQRVQDEGAGALANFPLDFPTHVWRNYTIVKDGLINVATLPVILAEEAWQVLGPKLGRAAPVALTHRQTSTVEVHIDLDQLPVLNRQLVKTLPTAREAAALEMDLTAARASQKVYKHLLTEVAAVEKSPTFVARYGQAAADWLKAQGITDGGFNPKRTAAPATDVYYGKELDIRIKGYAGDLPSVAEVRKKLAGAKPPTGLAGLMAKHLQEAEAWLKANPKRLHAAYLEGKAKALVAVTRGLLFRKAQLVFTCIVGQVWFPEFKSFEETSLDITYEGKPLQATFTLRDVEIKI